MAQRQQQFAGLHVSPVSLLFCRWMCHCDKHPYLISCTFSLLSLFCEINFLNVTLQRKEKKIAFGRWFYLHNSFCFCSQLGSVVVYEHFAFVCRPIKPTLNPRPQTESQQKPSSSLFLGFSLLGFHSVPHRTDADGAPLLSPLANASLFSQFYYLHSSQPPSSVVSLYPAWVNLSK